MKNSRKFLFGSLLLLGLQMVGMTGCVGGAVVGDGGGVYYGGDPWFHDDVWVNGGRGWYGGQHDAHGGGAYIHPAAAHAPAARGGGGDHHR
jgi:hypothetical protein